MPGPFDDPELQTIIRGKIADLDRSNGGIPWEKMLAGMFEHMNHDPALAALVTAIHETGDAKALGRSPVGKFLAMQLITNTTVIAAMPIMRVLDLREELAAVRQELAAARAAYAELEARLAAAETGQPAPGPVRW